jgi:hypothetical protein
LPEARVLLKTLQQRAFEFDDLAIQCRDERTASTLNSEG